MELVKAKQRDENEKYEKAKGSKKTKKKKRKEHEDDSILKGESERLVGSQRENEPKRIEEVVLDDAHSKHQKRKKHKKTKTIKIIDGHNSEDKRRKKEGKTKGNESEGSIEERKDDSKEYEENYVKTIKKDKKYDDESSREKHHKKKKKKSKNIDPDTTCEDLDTRKSKHEIGYDVGQWGSASFDTVEQKNKFIRLLGGYKHKANETSDKQLFSGLKKFNSAAMNKSEEEKLNKKLETQYQQAFDTSRKRKGFGLGYDASEDTNVKKFHIDVEQKSKSIKFE